jgi:hypothetical protein
MNVEEKEHSHLDGVRLPSWKVLAESGVKIAKPNEETIRRSSYDFDKFKDRFFTPCLRSLEKSDLHIEQDEIQFLEDFMLFAYRLDAFVTRGENDYRLARVVFASAVIEAAEAKANGKKVNDTELFISTNKNNVRLKSIDTNLLDTLELTDSPEYGVDYLETITKYDEINNDPDLESKQKRFFQLTPQEALIYTTKTIASSLALRQKDPIAYDVFLKRHLNETKLDFIASNMMWAETPPLDKKLAWLSERNNYSRMSVLAMDVYLRDRQFPAFAYGNWALNNLTKSSSYTDRWEKSDLTASDFGISDQKNIQLWETTPKGVLGTLQKALKSEKILNLMNSILESNHQDPRLRIQMFAEILDKHFSNSSNFDESQLNNLFTTVSGNISKIDDVKRARMVSNNPDEIIKDLTEQGHEPFLLTERKNRYGEPEIINTVIEANDDIKKKIILWHINSHINNAASSFAAAVIHTEIYGVNTELQITTPGGAMENWQSRKAYKSITKRRSY